MTQANLQDILRSAYSRQAFIDRILLPAFHQTTKDFQLFAEGMEIPIDLTETERGIAKSIVQYGSFMTHDKREVALYEVTVAEGRQVDRTRMGFWALLKKHLLGSGAALAVFKHQNPEGQTWRLSLIASDTALVDGQVETTFTQPKRFTYLLGENQKVKTAAERLNALAGKPEISLQDLLDAFSVAPLSKAFFDEYRDTHYQAFVQYLTKSNFKAAVFNGSEKAIRDFVKKLLGRIVFLYFLQKKGWLGATSDRYQDGDPDFMSHFFAQSGKDETFYTTCLSRLFFDTLNKKRVNDDFTMPDGATVKIPYLNGGLFEKESEKYDLLTFPPELFSDLFAFFDEYNFTVDEDSPHEHTVAVDPEMLGHIFENLLEDNKDKGTYYTPKEIVHYMTQASLVEYLHTRLPHLDHTTLENFVKDKAHGLTREDQREIDTQLDRVKICDPAIGSGAFPMGLLQEIFVLKARVAYEGGYKVWSPARVKEHIIQNSIYGVDIEKGAVDIARLRFWLSLIVDEEQPRPLPNLDYKIVSGNSLIGQFEGNSLEVEWGRKNGSNSVQAHIDRLQKSLKTISEKQKAFFGSAPTEEKQKLRADIRQLKLKALISQLTYNKLVYAHRTPIKNGFEATPKDRKHNLEREIQIGTFDQMLAKLQALQTHDKPFDYFDWRLDFPEVMNPLAVETTGFDIVIGNPPYVQVPKSYAPASTFPFSAGKDKGKQNLYKLFAEQAFNISKAGGMSCLIVQHSLMADISAEGTRELLLTQSRIKQVMEFPKHAKEKGGRVFTSTLQGTCIVMFEKTPPNGHQFLISSGNSKHTLADPSFESVKQQGIIKVYPNGKYFPLLRKGYFSVIQKIIQNKKTLKELMAKSSNGDFNVGISKSEFSEKQTPIKMLRGRNVHRFYLDYEVSEFMNPAFKQEHIVLNQKHQFILSQGITGTTDIHRLHFGLSDPTEKFLCGDSVKKFLLLNEKDNRLMLGILNSKLMDWLFRRTSTNNNVNSYEIEALPIPSITPANQREARQIESLVDKIIASKQANPHTDTTAEEQEVDELVFGLYGLSEKEIEVVKGGLK